MVKVGFLFAGQGAQTVGMGRDYYDASPAAKSIFQQANEQLGFDLAQLCFQGPESTLAQTINTQIAIFTTSLAILAAIKEKYPTLEPAVNCGLSLGEYAALVSASVLDFATTLAVVRQRGELMEREAQRNPGGMISLIGLPEDQCAAVAQECGLDVANYNSPEQIVLSGPKEAIAKAQEVALARGAKKGVILNVSGAFHSRLMAGAADHMQTVLRDAPLQAPASPLIQNVSAEFEHEPTRIKGNLIKQVSHAVKWTQTIERAVSAGIVDFLEIGPGKVLKGLARRINKDVTVYSIEKWDNLSDIEKVIAKGSNV